MKQIQLPFLSLALLTSASYAMQSADPTDYIRNYRSLSPTKSRESRFFQKVQACGLHDHTEISKFFELVCEHGIDINSKDVDYDEYPDNGILVFQKTPTHTRYIMRSGTGSFDIKFDTVDPVTGRVRASDDIKHQNKNYADALSIVRELKCKNSLFAQKVKELELTDEAEIKKFYDVVTGWGIDPNSSEVIYKRPQYTKGIITVRQKIDKGYREIIRLSDGTFDIEKLDLATPELRMGEYKARYQTYQMAMGYLDMLKSAKENKAKQAAEESLTMEDFLQRVARLRVNPEQQRANALANIPVVDFSAPAIPADFSRPTPPSARNVAVADKGFIHQAFGPDMAANKQKALEKLQQVDLKKWIDTQKTNGMLRLDWQEINALATFEADTPIAGRGWWKIHLGTNTSIVWADGFSLESKGPQL